MVSLTAAVRPVSNKGTGCYVMMELRLPSFRQTARLFVRVLIGLDLAFLAVCAVHSVFDYFHGGWPAVEGWYIHLQIEGFALGAAGWRHEWTWMEALRPELIYAAAAPVLWAVSRFLRPPDEDEVVELGAAPR